MLTPPPVPASSSLAENAQILPYIYGVTDCVAQLEKLDDVFAYILGTATRLTQADTATLHIFDFKSGTLQLARGINTGHGRHCQTILHIGQGLIGRVVRSGRAYRSKIPLADTSNTDRELANLDEAGEVLCVPLRARGRSFGCITVFRDRHQPFGEQELLLLNILAAEAVHAVEKARLIRELQAQATVDPLTGLLNKSTLAQKLAMEVLRSQRRHQPLSVLHIDVDDFAAFNDVHGCLMGDKLLHDFTRILCDHCRKIDLVGRLEGDDFIIVAPQTDTGGALALADKIQSALRQFAFLSSRADEIHHATCCIGIATFPEHGISADELMENARQALRASKRRGKNRTSVWSSGP